MSWLKKLLPKIGIDSGKKKAVPEGVWTKCPGCGAVLYRAEVVQNLEVCPKCDFHMHVSGRKRLGQFLDPDSYEEIASEVEAVDRLKFRDSKKYKDRLAAAQKATGETEALIVMRGQLKGLNLVAMAFDFNFIGGSMSAGVGERFVRGINAAMTARIPVVCFSTSGGARMQEGLFSLMQMAKTSAALAKLSEEGLPYLSILLDPTMGGVSASLAMLGDIIIAEPKARIGFAGRRVIEQTVRQTLPEGFQQSEFLLDHGAIDMIIDRRQLRDSVAQLLAKLTHQNIDV